MVGDPATRDLGVFTHTSEYPNLLTSRLTGPGIDSGTGKVPRVGANTEQVLRAHAGVSDADLDELRVAGVL